MIKLHFIDLDRRDTKSDRRAVGLRLLERAVETALDERWLCAGSERRESAEIWLHAEFARTLSGLGASEIAVVATDDRAHLFIHMSKEPTL